MPKQIDKITVFKALRSIISHYSGQLVVTTDNEANYCLDTNHLMKNEKRLFFGAVKIRKNYVSYHLMPVYVNPSLLDSVSAPLRKKMQGKSCFNFSAINADLMEELASLTEAGYQSYVKEGYIQADA